MDQVGGKDDVEMFSLQMKLVRVDLCIDFHLERCRSLGFIFVLLLLVEKYFSTMEDTAGMCDAKWQLMLGFVCVREAVG